VKDNRIVSLRLSGYNRSVRRGQDTFFYFLLFLFLSFIIYLLSATDGLQSVRTIIEKSFAPLYGLYSVLNFSSKQSETALQKENRELIKKLVDQTELRKENQALKDQFESSLSLPFHLMPAKVIATSVFIPGVSIPESFILDKGLANGVKKGVGVIFKDTVVGKIGEVTQHLSKIEVITNKSSSFAVFTLSSNALGIIKGGGNGEMTLENVLLSENLSIEDIVVTKGDSNKGGVGYPKGLIVGKILSIDKKPSSLFQSAKVKSLLDFSRLSTVFIIINK